MDNNQPNQPGMNRSLEKDSRNRKLSIIKSLITSDLLLALSATYLVFLVMLAIGGPSLMKADSNRVNLVARNIPPLGTSEANHIHWLGTDQLGRDELSRLIIGARVSLSIGFLSVLLSGAFGLLLGVLSGYFRGIADDIVMRWVDVQMGFPTLLLALFVLFVAGPSFTNVAITLAVTRWMVYARLSRALVLSLRDRRFVESSIALGASSIQIIIKHIIPNIASPIITLATLEISRSMLSEAALSFLGLGIQPPDASWGLMVAQGRAYITSAWWLVILPGTAIFSSALAFNLLALRLRDISDPIQRSALISS